MYQPEEDERCPDLTEWNKMKLKTNYKGDGSSLYLWITSCEAANKIFHSYTCAKREDGINYD